MGSEAALPLTGSRAYSGNGHRATIAEPSNITRDECLALARCGAEAWNAWREMFPVRGRLPTCYENGADFTEQDLSAGLFDFSGFRFGHDADFSEAKFGTVFFLGAEFGDCTRFIGVRFGERTLFQGARFGREACFAHSVFGVDCSFFNCEFAQYASFRGALFGESLSFRGSIFGDNAEFDWAHFDHRSSFAGTLFSGSASFVAASIGFEADFSGLMVGGALSFEAAKFEGQVKFRGLSWGELKQELQELEFSDGVDVLEAHAKEWHASPWVFKAVNFCGARFEGSVDFSDRHFEGVTEFARTAFFTESPGWYAVGDALVSHVGEELIANESGSMYLPEGRQVQFAWVPNFFQCKLHQNTSFEGAVFPKADGSSHAARAYGVLKLAFSHQQATREEQRFFRLEMAEEAKAAESSNNPARWLYVAYRELSDFGFSINRPLILLICVLALTSLLYAWQAGLHHCFPTEAACNKTGPLIQFAAASALPGFEKFAEPASKQLFGEQLGVWTVLTLLLHKAVSLLALFLIGLALRNLFKMK